MKKPDNQILVIFGASGDLTKRKLIPAITNLRTQKLLPDNFAILGVGRSNYTDAEFRSKIKAALIEYSDFDENNENDNKFIESLHYLAMDTSNIDAYKVLKKQLKGLNAQYNTNSNYIFYLSTPPLLYKTISENLGIVGLNDESKGSRKLIVEKPFGYNLKTAKDLNIHIKKYFEEKQIYRIDHYLGKETVQNILVSRFANGIFEPLWNRNYIDHVEITSAESIGVEDRGGYYDTSGALRDMIQNHLLQLMSLIAMEAPASFDSDAIRNETLKVLKSLRSIKPEDVTKQSIRGQYIASNIRGEKIAGYREEKNVAPTSKTETYAAIKFFIDNWRWGGVPFYIRSGKRLPTRVTEVVIHFKPTPHFLFNTLSKNESCNKLVLRIQPDEGILMKIGMKLPGTGYNVKNVNMDFHYSDLSDSYIPTAYERLIYDSMIGDTTLFSQGDAVEKSWEFVEPILHAWENDDNIPVHGYSAGTWGPEIADKLIEGDQITWRYPCKNLTDDGNYCVL